MSSTSQLLPAAILERCGFVSTRFTFASRKLMEQWRIRKGHTCDEPILIDNKAQLVNNAVVMLCTFGMQLYFHET